MEIPLDIISLVNSELFRHLLLITSLFWITWAYCLKPKWSFCIDDGPGVGAFSDRFIQTKDQAGNIIKEEKIDYYEQDVNGKNVKFGNFQFNPHLGFPASINRWLRTIWGRSFREIGKNSKGHSVYGFVQIAWKHHLLNLIVQYANCLLAYFFFSKIFNPQLAFATVLIFSVHPISVQVTGWISGVPYALGLLGTLIALNLSLYITNFFLLIPLISFFAAFSVLNMLPGFFTFAILFLIGKNEAGFVYLLVGFLVFLQQSNFVIKYRTNAFKEQQMGDSTRFYPRKIFIVLKTIWYYFKLIIFPKRLGLFHTFLYHFEETGKHFNWQALFGIVSSLACVIWYFFAPEPVKMGLVWYFIYLIVFSNFITANQIVSERYIFFPLVGFSLIVAYFLQSQPILLAFILGIYVMRVWVHLPTFTNEVRFYESNCFNFPDSEVAM